MSDFGEQIAHAAHLLRRSRYAVALTGAGVSTPSGIPDFRSARSGLWEKDDPLEVASLTAFRYHPERFYAWLRPLARTIYEAQPNPAHWALAALEGANCLKMLITQNIDLLHSRAGSTNVVEIHGSLREAVCGRCHRHWPGAPILERFIVNGAVPHCPDCGGVLKPDAVLMGEMLPERVISAAFAAAHACDVMLVAGTSLEVMPAARLPYEAATAGANLIIINRETTYLDERAEVLLPGDVADILPRLSAAVSQSETYA
jgi:NAD-dependent protein deacetylase/lipoamidase